MKRLISFCLVFIMMFSLCGCVNATQEDAVENKVVSDNVDEINQKDIMKVESVKVSEDIYELYAESLNKLGLFQGSEKGYELDKGLTRAEGATIVLRLVADEKEIVKKPLKKYPFTDVPKWADKNIGYLYSVGKVQGISKDKFGSQNNMSAKDFTTFMLRVLRYDDVIGDFNWETSLDKAVEIGLYDDNYRNELESRKFLRKDAVYIIGKTLKTNLKDSSSPLINNISHIDKDVLKYATIFYGESTVNKEEAGFEDNVAYYGGLNKYKMGFYDDKIYYIEENDPKYNKISIYDIDTKKKTYSDYYVSNFIIENDDIYMFASDKNKSNKGLYKSSLKDINNAKKISNLDDNRKYIILGLYKDEIYFYDMSLSDFGELKLYGKIYKINLNDDKKEIVINDLVSYYSNYMNGLELYYSIYDERDSGNSGYGLNVYNLDTNEVKTYLKDDYITGVIANDKVIIVNAHNNIYLINKNTEEAKIIYKNTNCDMYALYNGKLMFENNNVDILMKYNIYNGTIERIEGISQFVESLGIYDGNLYWLLWNDDKNGAELHQSDINVKNTIKLD